MGYELLPKGTNYAEWKDACKVLNRIHFTEEDAEQGISLLRLGTADNPALDQFVARFQDHQREFVIASLRTREAMLTDAECNGINLKARQPEVYASMLTGPLFPEDFGVRR